MRIKILCDQKDCEFNFTKEYPTGTDWILGIEECTLNKPRFTTCKQTKNRVCLSHTTKKDEQMG